MPVHVARQRVELVHDHDAVDCVPHGTDEGAKFTVHTGGEHPALTRWVIDPSAFRAVKSQITPPVSTRIGAVTGAPAPQSNGMRLPLHTASQLVALEHVHEAVASVPHATTLGAICTVHVGGAMHSPFKHICAAVHARPHIPQWAGLLAVSTHAETLLVTHSLRGAVQLAVHIERSQTWPTVHTLPQRPQ